MTKAEWASWSQSLGVVVSLLIALYFPIRSERKRQKDERREYINQRHALNELKQDVVQFIGYLTNYARNKQDLVIDEIRYGQMLERVDHFDVRLHDSSSKKLLFLIRRVLRSVYSYQHSPADGRDASGGNLVTNFRLLHYSKFNPEDIEYFVGRGDDEYLSSDGAGSRFSWAGRVKASIYSKFRKSNDPA